MIMTDLTPKQQREVAYHARHLLEVSRQPIPNESSKALLPSGAIIIGMLLPTDWHVAADSVAADSWLRRLLAANV
jgi:hypothetical protein